MWIEQKSNGKFLFREKFIDNLTEKEKTVSVTLDKNTRETRSKAQKLLSTKILKLKQNESRKIVPITFKDLAIKWETFYVKQVKDNSRLSIKANLKILIEAVGPESIVHKITTVYLNKKIENLVFGDRDISESYAKILKTRLKAIFEYGISHGHLKINPAVSAVIPKKIKDATMVTEFYLESNELKSLMDYLKGHNTRYYLLCQWLYLNGLRAGEGSAMQKNDVIISDDRQYCKVTGTLEYHGKRIADQVKSKETKTLSGMREVDLSKKAIEIYQEALSLSPDSTFLFTTSNNTPIQINALNAYLRAHKEEMGFDRNRKISTHIFRHTHISKLAEIGVPLHVIQRRVGHSSEKITREIYLHITNKMKSDTKDLLELL